MVDWKSRFSSPVRLKLHVMHTGEVRTKGNIHFNPKSPKFKEMPKEERFNPVFAYLVEHPDKGLLLLDTGLHHSFAERKSGNFGKFLGRMVLGRTEPGKDVCSQLKNIGKNPDDVRYILLSHLHLDHPSGLPYFAGLPNLKAYVDKEELASGESSFQPVQGIREKPDRGGGSPAHPVRRRRPALSPGMRLFRRRIRHRPSNSGTHERTLLGPVERDGRSDPADLRRGAPQDEP